MNFIEWAQRRLMAHGLNPAIADGEWGRRTLNATIAFQKARGLPARGRLNSATVQALLLEPSGIAPASKREAAPKQDLIDKFPWMRLALRKKSLHEGLDSPDLREFLKPDGNTLGDPAQLPWCGDFVETCIAVTLLEAILPVNPYVARNWLKFGQTVDPCYGAVMVFWRGSRSGSSGQVGFYYSEDQEDFHILGGNQKHSISVTSVKKDRLLGARLPYVGGPFPRRVVNSSADFALAENEF